MNKKEYEKVKSESFLGLWLIMISAVITFVLEVTSRIIGYWNVTAFTYVITVYFFLVMFVFMRYKSINRKIKK